MRTLYSWPDVAERTETVYTHAMNTENEDLLQRLERYDAAIEQMSCLEPSRFIMRFLQHYMRPDSRLTRDKDLLSFGSCVVFSFEKVTY